MDDSSAEKSVFFPGVRFETGGTRRYFELPVVRPKLSDWETDQCSEVGLIDATMALISC